MNEEVGPPVSNYTRVCTHYLAVDDCVVCNNIGKYVVSGQCPNCTGKHNAYTWHVDGVCGRCGKENKDFKLTKRSIRAS